MFAPRSQDANRVARQRGVDRITILRRFHIPKSRRPLATRRENVESCRVNLGGGLVAVLGRKGSDRVLRSPDFLKQFRASPLQSSANAASQARGHHRAPNTFERSNGRDTTNSTVSGHWRYSARRRRDRTSRCKSPHRRWRSERNKPVQAAGERVRARNRPRAGCRLPLRSRHHPSPRYDVRVGSIPSASCGNEQASAPQASSQTGVLAFA
jgi:hypothetical protein